MSDVHIGVFDVAMKSVNTILEKVAKQFLRKKLRAQNRDRDVVAIVVNRDRDRGDHGRWWGRIKAQDRSPRGPPGPSTQITQIGGITPIGVFDVAMS